MWQHTKGFKGKVPLIMCSSEAGDRTVSDRNLVEMNSIGSIHYMLADNVTSQTNPFNLGKLKRLLRLGWLSRTHSVKRFQRPTAVVPRLALWDCIIDCITYYKPIGL